MNTHLSFACDYMEGTHPAILQKLVETNLEKTGGYGLDPYCDAAKKRSKRPVAVRKEKFSFW